MCERMVGASDVDADSVRDQILPGLLYAYVVDMNVENIYIYVSCMCAEYTYTYVPMLRTYMFICLFVCFLFVLNPHAPFVGW